MKWGTVILGVGGFLLGLLGTRLPEWVGGADHSSETVREIGERLPASESSAAGNTPAVSGRPHDLTGLIRLWPELKVGDPAMLREVERLDAPALKLLITGLAAELKPPSENVPLEYSELLRFAVKQLFKLEGEEAMSWAIANMGEKPASDIVMTSLVNAAAHDSPELARRWKEEYEARGGIRFFFYEGFSENAADLGAEGVMRLHRLGVLRYGFGANGFPDDFDFHRAVTGIAKEASAGGWSYVNCLMPAVLYWTAKDRDAAWDGIAEVMATSRDAGYFVAEYIKQIQETEGDHYAAKFLAERFGDIPKDARRIVLSEQCRRFPEASLELINLLPEVDDRIMLARSYLHPRNQPEDTLRALQALGSEKLQAEALMVSAKELADSLSMNGEREQGRAYFAGILEQSKISPDRRAEIEAALPAAEAK